MHKDSLGAEVTRRQLMRTGIGVGALGILSPALAACGSSGSSGATTAAGRSLQTWNFQLGWLHGVEWAGTYLAADRGYHADEGLRLNLIPGGPQVNAEPRIASGRANAGIVYGLGVATANKEGAKLRILASKLQKSPVGIVTLASSGIADIHGLVGKKLGVATNSVTAVQAYLRGAGVDPSKVAFVPVQFDFAPLTSGQVDAFYSYYTEISPLVDRGLKTRFFFESDTNAAVDMPDMYGTTQDVIDQHRDTLVGLMRAEVRGWQDFVEDPEAGVALAVGKYGKAAGLSRSEQQYEARAYVDLITDGPTVRAKGLLWTSPQIKTGVIDVAAASDAPLDGSAFDDTILRDAYAGKTRI